MCQSVGGFVFHDRYQEQDRKGCYHAAATGSLRLDMAQLLRLNRVSKRSSKQYHIVRAWNAQKRKSSSTKHPMWTRALGCPKVRRGRSRMPFGCAAFADTPGNEKDEWVGIVAMSEQSRAWGFRLLELAVVQEDLGSCGLKIEQ